ncbi:GNAT family N-acetyltransferase [Paractinoplanes atraurantiacus]|nr:GNAT family N-acetyltransferase [Actinoplanes atraurantiacus]
MNEIVVDIAPARLPGTARWLAVAPCGFVAGRAGLWSLPPPAPPGTAELSLSVEPGWRRRGIGSRLLAAVRDDAGGRRLLAGVDAGSPGEGFCRRHGFRRTGSRRHDLLTYCDVHQAWLSELVDADHPGYRLTSWTGDLPSAFRVEDLLPLPGRTSDVSPGHVREGMPVHVRDGLPVHVRDGLPVHVRDGMLGRGRDALPGHGRDALPGRLGDAVLTAAAAGGDVAAYAVAIAGGQSRARQYGPAVLPGHRGRQVGLWVNAALIQRLREVHPSVTEIEATGIGDDAGLLAARRQLGFRPLRRTHLYELP